MIKIQQANINDLNKHGIISQPFSSLDLPTPLLSYLANKQNLV